VRHRPRAPLTPGDVHVRYCLTESFGEDVLATAAALHVAAVAPNLSLFEMPADDYLWAATWRDEFLLDPTPVIARDGHLPLPTRPGLGIELNDAAIAAHPIRL